MFEASPREAADADAAGARSQRIDPMEVVVDYVHRYITVNDGELGGERVLTRRSSDWRSALRLVITTEPLIGARRCT
jgi:hypothetical protein